MPVTLISSKTKGCLQHGPHSEGFEWRREKVISGHQTVRQGQKPRGAQRRVTLRFRKDFLSALRIFYLKKFLHLLSN